MENENQPPAPKKQRYVLKGCMVIFALMFLFQLFFAVMCGCIAFAVYMLDNSSEKEDHPEIRESVLEEGDGKEKLVRIDVSGVILEKDDHTLHGTDSDTLCRMLEKAERDPRVRGVILHLNTPGGEVTAADTVYQKILEVRKKKPVIAFMSSIAASGGYYIAAGCNRIIASRTTLTGSIGVIISTYNFKEFCDWFGIHSEVYKSGPMKDMLNPLGKRTSEEEKIVQDLVNESYALFLKLVSEGRKISVEKLRESPACDGRILSAQEALKYKLIDRIGRFEDGIADLEKLVSVPSGSLSVVQYECKVSFLDALMSIRSPAPSRVSVELPGIRKESLPAGRLYFLPASF